MSEGAVDVDLELDAVKRGHDVTPLIVLDLHVTLLPAASCLPRPVADEEVDHRALERVALRNGRGKSRGPERCVVRTRDEDTW